MVDDVACSYHKNVFHFFDDQVAELEFLVLCKGCGSGIFGLFETNKLNSMSAESLI